MGRVTRRTVFGLLSLIGFEYCPPRRVIWFSDVTRIGETGNQWSHPVRVFLDDLDITHRCFGVYRFSDGTAEAHCYRTGEAGGFLMTPDGGSIQRCVVGGDIRIETWSV